MAIISENNSLVLIIDVQEKLLNAVFNKTELEKKSTIISNACSLLGIPVLITEQYPKGLGSTISPIRDSVKNCTEYFEKTSFSALDNPMIADAIQKSGKKQIIVFGIETHICVNQTVNALVNSGYDVTVISDACGSRSEKEHLAGLERIKEHNAHIITTEIALFEWLKDSRHTKFKEIQSLIK